MSESKIQDVARLAGVSTTSVSNFLNNRMGQMRPDTQRKIQQAIEQLGYRPNNAARQLKTGVASMVGLLVPSLANQFFGSLACAVETAAARHHCHVMTFSTFRDPERERAVMADLLAYGAQGIITGSALNDTGHLVGMTARCPVVAFDIKRSDDSHERITTISVDNVAATTLAVEHLAALGHRAIALVTPPPYTLNRQDRVKGFEQAVAAAGISGELVIADATDAPADLHGDTRLFELGRSAATLLLAARSKPTAAIAINDMMAIGIGIGLKQLGKRLPQDFSLIGIDDIFFSAANDPPLTTLRQPIQAMADAAVQRILAPGAASAGGELFAPELIVRASTAAPPT
ncbi:DNA-binding LacI/PurR family transcriptional regulator [Duganella sp. 1411]|uniref:LacI family DNA-binding transcriptional regulator n=1 Tax=Duganella sp. 1411 TaxID=2806572 RepID=UPI001AE961B9|nr:LacI family DNA-binding transcriptional regulator [Duganella sp. 1411]MBP1204943.1 DNA-binding LacI/PurR family transcriptional regulator [Duganella sp. 1411]